MKDDRADAVLSDCRGVSGSHTRESLRPIAFTWKSPMPSSASSSFNVRSVARENEITGLRIGRRPPRQTCLAVRTSTSFSRVPRPTESSKGFSTSDTGLSAVERLPQVGHEVVGRLYADREPNERVWDLKPRARD